jgi:hypothetical protein
MRRKFNHYMLIQWILFAPLIIPLGIIFGAFEGIRHTMRMIYEQVKTDVSKDIEELNL